MCGIVGIMGKPGVDQDAVFETLLQIDVLRGHHSTGMFAVKKKSIKSLKAACLPQELMATQDYKNILRDMNYCLVGHNRYATRGEVNDENAHPFSHGSITGVHNGTSHVWDLPDKEKFKVDSDNIIYSISTIGIDETWKKINGGTTLVYWDNSDRTLNWVSNGKRPLFWYYLKNKAGILFGSDQDMLLFAARRHDLDIEDKGWFPPNHVLFTIKWMGNRVEVTSRKLEEFSYAAQSYSYPVGYGGEAKPTPQITVQRGRQDEWGNPGEDFEDRLFDWYSSSDCKKKSCTVDQFHNQYKCCCGCGEPLTYSEAIIIDNENAVCDGCCQTALMNNLDLTKIQKGA